MLYQWVSKLVLRFQSSAAATSLYTQEFLLSPSSSSVHSHSSHTFPFLPIPPPFSPPSPVISLCLWCCAESCRSEFLLCGRNPGRSFQRALTFLFVTHIPRETGLWWWVWVRSCAVNVLSSDYFSFSPCLISDIATLCRSNKKVGTVLLSLSKSIQYRLYEGGIHLPPLKLCDNLNKVGPKKGEAAGTTASQEMSYIALLWECVSLSSFDDYLNTRLF